MGTTNDWAWMDIRDDPVFIRFMWASLAEDVRGEFHYEGIKDAEAFRQDIVAADHRESFWKMGTWVGAIWCGWVADGVRSFGAVVRRPDELPGRVWLAKRSREMLDGFMSREPGDAMATEVLIPPFLTRCIRHAEMFCGLERKGRLTDEGGKEYLVFGYERRAEP